MSSQVLFDIEHPAHDMIVQAIVALSERQEATWPLGNLNKMLELFYKNSVAVPLICEISESGQVVGYLTVPYNSCRPDRFNPIFWDAMLDSGAAIKTDDGYEFTTTEPATADTEVGHTAVLGYQQIGTRMPLDAINYAMRMLLGQMNWPTNLAPFLYKVAKGASSLLAGVWVAPTVDNLDDNPDADDSQFRAIRSFNYPHEVPLRSRHEANAAYQKAISRFPDFQAKEF